MRRPNAWLLVVIVSLVGCAAKPARDVAHSHVTKREAVEFVAMPPPESSPEGDDLLLDVVDVGGGLCVIGLAPEGWEFLIDEVIRDDQRECALRVREAACLPRHFPVVAGRAATAIVGHAGHVRSTAQ